MWFYHQVAECLGPGCAAAIEGALGGWLHSLATLSGFEAVIARIFPSLLVVEAVVLLWANRRSLSKVSTAYKVPAMMHIANIVISGLINVQVFLWTQRHFSAVAPFKSGIDGIGFVYAYLVWELSHFVFHYSCHNVRFLWIMHAPHHAPNHMNLSVILSGSFAENIYATFLRTMICSALGVPLPLLVLAMTIDACWGSLIHVSEEVWPSGVFGGILSRLILSPAHHRIHHASNAEYIDKNYCNTLPLWDMVFGTLQTEIAGVAPLYGLARSVKRNSFLDMYFGELKLLIRDMAMAPSIKVAMLYAVMPPGWHPIKPASTARDEFMAGARIR